MEANGKKHSAFTIMRTLRRRKFYLLVPVVLITAAVVVYSGKLPVRFRARTLVASENPAPEPSLSGKVDTVATVNVQEQLRGIRETILAPSLLETVIREFNLYDVSDARELERALAATRARIQIQ